MCVDNHITFSTKKKIIIDYPLFYSLFALPRRTNTRAMYSGKNHAIHDDLYARRPQLINSGSLFSPRLQHFPDFPRVGVFLLDFPFARISNLSASSTTDSGCACSAPYACPATHTHTHHIPRPLQPRSRASFIKIHPHNATR